MGPGKLLFIHIASSSAEAMQELSYGTNKNKGIKGDRYFKGNGKYSNIPDIRDVTIIEKEFLTLWNKINHHFKKKALF